LIAHWMCKKCRWIYI